MGVMQRTAGVALWHEQECTVWEREEESLQWQATVLDLCSKVLTHKIHEYLATALGSYNFWLISPGNFTSDDTVDPFKRHLLFAQLVLHWAVGN